MKHMLDHLAHGVLVVAILTGVSGCLSGGDSSNVAIWAADGATALDHDSPPAAETEVYSAERGRLQLVAALNETIGFQVALRSSAARAGTYDVAVTDLTSPTETLQADVAVARFRVHDVAVDAFPSWYAAHVGKPLPKSVPDILVPWDAPRGGGPVVLDRGRTELVWIDVRIPATIAPGTYRGQLRVGRPEQAPAFVSEIELEVLPVALPGRRSLPLICRVDPRDLLETHLRWPRTSAADTRLIPSEPAHAAPIRLVNQTMALLHEHRTTPVLWASFPKFQVLNEREVAIDWQHYDELVGPWLDGSAFADRVPLARWPVPVSLEYPSAARSGGFFSPQYARLLAAYLAECKQHFAERGWLDRAFLRVCPPEPLATEPVAQIERLTRIVRQSEAALPVVAHLPGASLRGLGWIDAPSIDLPDVDIWAPPAMWFEPDALAEHHRLGDELWLLPGRPPYSGSLAPLAPDTDVRALPWIAYRYDVGALWLEDATAAPVQDTATTALRPWSQTPLVYPGTPYGLRDRGPVPSLRLKRLRRGLQDYELLKLLEANGEQLLAQEVAGQIIRWAMTDACDRDLLSTRPAGWPGNDDVMRRARVLMLRELAGQFAPGERASQAQFASLAEWSLLFQQAERVAAEVAGVRLTPAEDGLRAHILTTVASAASAPVRGEWLIFQPPEGWTAGEPAPVAVAPGARRSARLSAHLSGLSYNTDGVYPFDMLFETARLGPLQRPARLAVAACMRFVTPPAIDGALSDWPLAANNAAGDFRLCHSASSHVDRRPELATRAFFGRDATHLYVAVRAALDPGNPPIWEASNVVPVDGAIPWGEDVIEVLLDPRAMIEGTPSDVYCLQIKPNGVLLATHGCRTAPPIGEVKLWYCQARVAARLGRDVWTIELAIPLEAFEPDALENPIWGLNITRLDARRGEYSSWSGARGHCYHPETLGNLIMLWP